MSAVAEHLAQLIHREGPITFDRFMEVAPLRGGRLLRDRPRRGSRRARLRDESRGRAAVRGVRRRAPSTACGARSTNPTRSSSSRPARATAASRARCCAPSPSACRRCATCSSNGRARLRAEQRDASRDRTGRRGARAVRAARGRRPGGRRARRRAGVHRARGAARARGERRGRDRERVARQPPVRDRRVGRHGAGSEVRVGRREAGGVRRGARPDRRRPRATRSAPGTRVPIPRGIADWWRECEAVVRHGFVLAIDYTTTVAELGARPWLRTYRAHAAGTAAARRAGRAGHHRRRRARTARRRVSRSSARAPIARPSGSRALGIDELVDEGRRIWEAGAARGDLEALAGRSRITEAAALTDPAGLGAHHVVLFAAAARAETSPGERGPTRGRSGVTSLRGHERDAFRPPARRPHVPAAGGLRQARAGHRRRASTTTPSATGRASGPRQALALDWHQEWDTILDWELPFAKWFVGGKLNVSENCLDRHVDAGHGDQVAFHWEGEPGDSRAVTYRELLDETSRVAEPVARARRRQGRPRRDLHGHGARDRRRDARVRADRRGALGRVRRLHRAVAS